MRERVTGLDRVGGGLCFALRSVFFGRFGLRRVSFRGASGDDQFLAHADQGVAAELIFLDDCLDAYARSHSDVRNGISGFDGVSRGTDRLIVAMSAIRL